MFINVTSVDGIYSSDPNKDKKAQRFRTLTPEQLLAIVGGTALTAGSNTVLDIVAARVVERSHIPLVVLDGRDSGKPFPRDSYGRIHRHGGEREEEKNPPP